MESSTSGDAILKRESFMRNVLHGALPYTSKKSEDEVGELMKAPEKICK